MAHARLAGNVGGSEGVYSQGQLQPIPQSAMVQASAGIGHYGSDDDFRPLAPFGSSPDGIGAYARPVPYGVPQNGAINSGSLGKIFGGSPLLRALDALKPKSVSGLGLGDDASVSPAPVYAASGLLVAVVAVGIAATAVSGYYVGKAVAPSREKQTKYAWWGVAAALLGGPVGLGIESAVALTHGRG